MGSESGVGVRGKVLHPGFRAQSVIKILVIGLASVLRTFFPHAAVSIICNSLQKNYFWNRSLD